MKEKETETKNAKMHYGIGFFHGVLVCLCILLPLMTISPDFIIKQIGYENYVSYVRLPLTIFFAILMIGIITWPILIISRNADDDSPDDAPPSAE